METCPFGPWRRLGAQPQQQAEPEDSEPGFEEPKTQAWRTDTAIDLYTPLYLALAQHTKTHGPIGPSEAGDMDLSVVAAMLGVGRDDWADWSAEMMAGVAEARAKGEEWTWPD